jgi:phosphotransferase system IIB component
MAERRSKVFFVGLSFFLSSLLIIHSQSILTVNEIVEKNIQAAGGKENLAKVKNYSFKNGLTMYYMSTKGIMKQTEGKEPIITEVILAGDSKVRRNYFNNVTEFTGLEKSTFQCLAQLRCGLFTLANFKDKLKFMGLKNFGPKKYYMLTTHMGGLEVEFYLDSDEFTLRRMVLNGFDPSQGKYEVNHDFGPYQDIEGVKIPSSWFGSQIGTTRGSSFLISDVKINQSLDENFFTKLDVNVGRAEVQKGALNGNVVEYIFRRGRLQIATNWTNEFVQKAGFQAGDKLILQIGGMDLEIDFYASRPPRGTIKPGAKYMIPNFRGENYFIILGQKENEQLSEKLETLLPIRVKRK